MLALLLLLQGVPSVYTGNAKPNPDTAIFQGRDKSRDRAHDRRTHPTAPAANRLQACLDQAHNDAEATAIVAQAWLKQTKGSAQAEPYLCLGSAQALQDDWAEAEASFAAGRDIAAASDHEMKARLGAMVGNAALAQDAPDRALAALEPARAEAGKAEQAQLSADIALDQARALVALHREREASSLLAEARVGKPDDAQVWLLSAVLSRRLGKLAEAQGQIEKAAELKPIDPDIGLEAGVIAMLAGHPDAARKSWQSVITAGPESASAATAKGYLAQLDPPPADKPH